MHLPRIFGPALFVSRKSSCARGSLIFLIAASLSLFAHAAEKGGSDLIPVFARAHTGQPLRAVAIGTSFTQGGKGWIGDWLKAQFSGNPCVSLRNSGMSAMGLVFHTFRLERDAIAFQPDLVLLESGPNDADLDDDGVLRYLESIVVRLKRLEHPPAIVIVDSCGRNTRVNRKVAEHYGLLEVDVNQAMLDEYTRDPGMKARMTIPDGHPSQEGNAYFSRMIGSALQPFVEKARGSETKDLARKALPSVLSKKPLLLDARLVQLTPEMAEGWTMTSNPAEAQRRQYLGTLCASTPGAQITIPARGTALGIFYAMQKKEYGRFYAGIDGNLPQEVDSSSRGGYSFVYFGDNLAPSEHLLRIVLPRSQTSAAPVHLGYLMVAGDHGCSPTLAPQGGYDAAALQKMSFRPLTAAAWWWSGPFGADSTNSSDTLTTFKNVYPPETAEGKKQRRALLAGTAENNSEWRPLAGETPHIDFENMTGLNDRGVCYAATNIQIPNERKALVRLIADYYCQVWVNGTEVSRVDFSHGSADNALPFFPVELRGGDNEVLVKLAAGGRGNRFSLALSNCEDAVFGFMR